jgi:hypothetical protein
LALFAWKIPLHLDKVTVACSEDMATLESDLSAAAGGRPMCRSHSGCGLLFSAHRDTHKAINSGDKSGEAFRLALHFSPCYTETP